MLIFFGQEFQLPAFIISVVSTSTCSCPHVFYYHDNQGFPSCFLLL